MKTTLNNAVSIDPAQKLEENFSSKMLAAIQSNSSITDRNQLMICVGLSWATIEKLMVKLNLEMKADGIVLTDAGISALEDQVSGMNGLERFNHILDYYQLVPAPEYLRLIGLSFPQYAAVIEFMAAKSGVLKKRSCAKAYSHIAKQLSCSKTHEYTDHIVEAIRGQFLAG